MQKYEDRILFLKEFTKFLIINSKPAEMPVKEEEEQEIIVPFLEQKEEEKLTQEMPGEEMEKSIMETFNVPTKPRIQPTHRIIPIQQTPQRYTLKPVLPRKFQPSIANETRNMILPVPSAAPSGFDLTKLNFLVQDPRVTVIECPGPNKLVIARTEGRIAVTKVYLSQEEITAVLDKFAKEARIPLIGGLFKAAVGNLVITAVTSDVVGSRFIITKITPRFIIEQQGNPGYI